MTEFSGENCCLPAYSQPFYKKFYAVVSSDFIAIMTSWDKVIPLIQGVPNIHRAFPNYYRAFNFIYKSLSEEDRRRFYLDRKKLAFDEIRRCPKRPPKQVNPFFRNA